MKKSELGRSMVEMLGVLAIVGVLSAGSLAMYSRAMAKHKENRTVEQMIYIVNNIRTVFYKPQEMYKPYKIFGKNKAETQSGMIQAVNLNIFPEDMIVDREQGKVQNLYKGSVYIITEDQGVSFEVIFENLPKNASIALSTLDWGSDDTSGLQGVSLSNIDD